MIMAHPDIGLGRLRINSIIESVKTQPYYLTKLEV